MRRTDICSLMWVDACASLARIERFRYEWVSLRPSPASQASWEPPVDMIAVDGELMVTIALPGIDANSLEIAFDPTQQTLIVAAERPLPAALQRAQIHRLEIPWGRFERRIPLPVECRAALRSEMANGCMVVVLSLAENPAARNPKG